MSRDLDYRLARRAAAGDERAFDQLMAAHAGKLTAVARSWSSDSETELDDLRQIVLERVWRGIKTGDYNGHVDFRVYLARVGSHALRDDWQRRRAGKRWDPLGPPVSLDLVVDPDPDPESDAPVYRFPSWSLGVDPLTVVLQRERLREAWQGLTAGQANAINVWLRQDGHGLPGNLVTAVAAGRKRVAPMLADAMATPLRLV